MQKESPSKTMVASQTPQREMIVRSEEPQNLEYPFAALEHPITPNGQFFVRSRFPTPALHPGTWQLRVEGAVERAFELSYEALLELPAVTSEAVLECAGNSRSALSPAVAGVPWDSGAVGCARWTGVPLAALLERAGLRAEAVEVILEGSDEGRPTESPLPEDKLKFARSLPLAKARQSEVLLAYEMNGETLSPAHGFPLRVITPGWYGMASVKWLSRIIVTDRPFHGYYQSTDYAYWEEQNGVPSRTAITETQVKAQIARPVPGEVIPANTVYRIFGAAWTGDAEVARVDISVDDGASYQPATLLAEPKRHSWCFWKLVWQTPSQAGKYLLRARATDTCGRSQSQERDANRGSYLISHVLPVEVEIT